MADQDRAAGILEQSVDEQRARAEALFYSIGDGAIATDEFGRITRVNAIARHILGFKKSELIGEWFPKKIVSVTSQDVPVNLIDRPIIKAFLTGQPITEKTYYRRKNGQKVPVVMTVSPILVNGKPRGAIEVFRDITFEQEVDRMKSEFISLASHQLRTPLSAIQTYSNMLAAGYMGEISPPQREALETIIKATERMNELISTLLNITRMESGSIPVNMRSLPVSKLAGEVLKELALLASEKSIKLSLKTAGNGSGSIKTDRFILKEIITNLVTNAIKYTPENGRVKVTVRLRLKNVLIQVTDTGWGIPKLSQDQIFNKFFRGHNVVKRETSGTGLGLYLVKGLVETLDGRIWFKSREGEGTDFFVELPRTAQPAAERDTQSVLADSV
ncbi:MAG TPA: ATP-binding protein [Candidatus Saccharimonadales bacterium]|nr:ATP-binding protein [Candidatus Saccharimonadales bacterium]